MKERYVIKRGKFGCYFLDKDDRQELTLDQVKKKLNELNQIKELAIKKKKKVRR